MRFLKGVHYQNRFFYDVCDWLKRGSDRSLRFRLVAQEIRSQERVLDICAGLGTLKEFLPRDVTYYAFEQSQNFLKYLDRKAEKAWKGNLHLGIREELIQADVVVMIISLSQFRQTSEHSLLESFKKFAKRKVVIVEELSSKQAWLTSVAEQAMHYFCSTDYYVPRPKYTYEEFFALMERHHYRCEKIDKGLAKASYP